MWMKYDYIQSVLPTPRGGTIGGGVVATNHCSPRFRKLMYLSLAYYLVPVVNILLTLLADTVSYCGNERTSFYCYFVISGHSLTLSLSDGVHINALQERKDEMNSFIYKELKKKEYIFFCWLTFFLEPKCNQDTVKIEIIMLIIFRKI